MATVEHLLVSRPQNDFCISKNQSYTYVWGNGTNELRDDTRLVLNPPSNVNYLVSGIYTGKSPNYKNLVRSYMAFEIGEEIKDWTRASLSIYIQDHDSANAGNTVDLTVGIWNMSNGVYDDSVDNWDDYNSGTFVLFENHIVDFSNDWYQQSLEFSGNTIKNHQVYVGGHYYIGLCVLISSDIGNNDPDAVIPDDGKLMVQYESSEGDDSKKPALYLNYNVSENEMIMIP